jgi:hypothetical protein
MAKLNDLEKKVTEQAFEVYANGKDELGLLLINQTKNKILSNGQRIARKDKKDAPVKKG